MTTNNTTDNNLWTVLSLAVRHGGLASKAKCRYLAVSKDTKAMIETDTPARELLPPYRHTAESLQGFMCEIRRVEGSLAGFNAYSGEALGTNLGIKVHGRDDVELVIQSSDCADVSLGVCKPHEIETMVTRAMKEHGSTLLHSVCTIARAFSCMREINRIMYHCADDVDIVLAGYIRDNGQHELCKDDDEEEHDYYPYIWTDSDDEL